MRPSLPLTGRGYSRPRRSREARRRAGRGKSPPLAWKTYVNARYGYSVRHPAHRAVRPFDTGAGAVFGLSAADTFPGRITVDRAEIPESHRAMPFARYVRVAAIQEIQGDEKPASISPVPTASGLTGYLTTWRVNEIVDLGKSVTTTSLPITCFRAPGPPATTQVSLRDSKQRSAYLRMIRRSPSPEGPQGRIWGVGEWRGERLASPAGIMAD